MRLNIATTDEIIKIKALIATEFFDKNTKFNIDWETYAVTRARLGAIEDTLLGNVGHHLS